MSLQNFASAHLLLLNQSEQLGLSILLLQKGDLLLNTCSLFQRLCPFFADNFPFMETFHEIVNFLFVFFLAFLPVCNRPRLLFLFGLSLLVSPFCHDLLAILFKDRHPLYLLYKGNCVLFDLSVDAFFFALYVLVIFRSGRLGSSSNLVEMGVSSLSTGILLGLEAFQFARHFLIVLCSQCYRALRFVHRFCLKVVSRHG